MAKQRVYPTASLTVIDILTTLSRDYARCTAGIRSVIDRNVGRSRAEQELSEATRSQPQPIVVEPHSRGIVSVELRQKGVCRAGMRFAVRAPNVPPAPSGDELKRGSVTNIRWDFETAVDMRVRFLLTEDGARHGLARRQSLAQPLTVLPEAALRLMLDTCGHRRGLTVAVAPTEPVAELDVSAWSAAAPWIRCFAKAPRAHVLVRAMRIQVYDFGARAPRYYERPVRYEALLSRQMSA